MSGNAERVVSNIECLCNNIIIAFGKLVSDSERYKYRYFEQYTKLNHVEGIYKGFVRTHPEIEVIMEYSWRASKWDDILDTAIYKVKYRGKCVYESIGNWRHKWSPHHTGPQCIPDNEWIGERKKLKYGKWIQKFNRISLVADRYIKDILQMEQLLDINKSDMYCIKEYYWVRNVYPIFTQEMYESSENFLVLMKKIQDTWKDR